MASAASKLKQLTDSVDAVMKSSEKTKQSWKTITDQFSKIVDIQGKLRDIEAARARGESTRGMGERALKTQLELLTKNNQFIAAGVRLREHEAFAIIPDLIAELGLVAKLQEQYNDALIRSNTGFIARLSLLGQIALVQIRTGASSQVMSESIAAATKYGHDLGNEFGSALEIITMMKVGLGVSADTTSEMLAVTKSIGGSWQEVVDGVARVKTETALAAEQAERYATEVGRAQALLGGKTPGKMVGPVGEYLSGLEGAAQEIGMQQGEIVKMVTGFTKTKGLIGLSTLGYDPSFLKDLNKTKGVVEGFAKMVDARLSSASGAPYMLRAQLDLMTEQFNTTEDVVGRINEVLAVYNKRLKSGTTMQQEWENQTGTITSAWNRLKNSLEGILQGALLPLIYVSGRVLGFIADIVDEITKFKEVVIGLGIAINLFILKQAAGWIMAIRAAGTTSALSAATGIAAEAGGAAGKGTLAVRGWKMVTTYLPSLGRLATAVFSLPVFLGAVLGAVLGFGVNKIVDAYYDAADKANLQNSSHYARLGASGQGGISQFKWVADAQSYFMEHKKLTMQEKTAHLLQSMTEVNVVKSAVASGEGVAETMRLLAGRYKDMADAQIRQQYQASGLTLTENEDMKRAQEQLDQTAEVAANISDSNELLKIIADEAKASRAAAAETNRVYLQEQNFQHQERMIESENLEKRIKSRSLSGRFEHY